MKVIHLLRKPCSEGTVAANALRWGTGALNIDGSRVAGEPPSVPQPAFNRPTGHVYGMKTGEGRNGEMSHAAGRWPANLVFQHLDGCRQAGTREAGSGARRVNDKEEVHEGVHEGYKRPNKSSYTHKIVGQTRQYGTETVTAWACGAGCPVAGLDAQSGTTKAVMRKPTGKPIYATEGTAMVWNSNSVTDTTERGFADEGGASRFFKQVGGATKTPTDG